jgi:hypothetical protein
MEIPNKKLQLHSVRVEYALQLRCELKGWAGSQLRCPQMHQIYGNPY